MRILVLGLMITAALAQASADEIPDYLVQALGDRIDNAFLKFKDGDGFLPRGFLFAPFLLDTDIVPTVPDDWDPVDICEKYGDENGVEDEYGDGEGPVDETVVTETTILADGVMARQGDNGQDEERTKDNIVA